jgi:hypothetical protein
LTKSSESETTSSSSTPRRTALSSPAIRPRYSATLLESRDHLRLALGRIDRLEPELRDALLAPRLADRGLRPLAAEEGPRALRVPRAPLVVADPACARGEQRVPDRIERLTGDENDELPVHVC